MIDRWLGSKERKYHMLAAARVMQLRQSDEQVGDSVLQSKL